MRSLLRHGGLVLVFIFVLLQGILILGSQVATNLVANYLQLWLEEYPAFKTLQTGEKLLIFLSILLIVEYPALKLLSTLIRRLGTQADRATTSSMRIRTIDRDILRDIHPGTSLERARAILGPPYREREMWLPGEGRVGGVSLIYKFANLYMQVESRDNREVDIVTIMKHDTRQKDRFEIYPLRYELGKLKLGDIRPQCGSLEVHTASKDAVVFTECSFGYPGFYYYYTFGVYVGGGVYYGISNFGFVDATQSVTGNPDEIVPNFVSIAKNQGHGHPIHFSDLQ